MISKTVKTTVLLLFFSQLIFSQWSKITTTGNVPHLKNHSTIYHPASNSMFVFGGRTASGDVSAQLWKLDLTASQWSLLSPTGTPPAPRYTQNAYYDSLLNRMIIWSGQGAAQSLFNDVWAYNISSNAWQQLWPDSNQAGVPMKRYGTASVFDPLNRRFVTFAGFTNSGRFEDTWTFNVDNMQWIERTNNPHPPKRCLHAAVFVTELRKMIIYAGQDTGPLDDIWSLNIDDFQWQNLTPQLKPPARFWNSTIYSGNGVIIFGGLGSNALADMWKFSVNTNLWEQVSQGSTIPGARWGHSGIYIPQQDRMIIFGGEGDSLYKDTWQFTNVSVIGIQQISGSVPRNFSLEQSYPNPFNPGTKIRYQIPDNTFVSLKIYNANGKMIETIVNQIQNAGTYEADFDGSNLASGVYFYRLEAEGFTQTRKMILIK